MNANAIRKDKKEEGLAKRRNLGAEVTPAEEDPTDIGTSLITTEQKKTYTTADIPNLFAGMKSSDISVQIDCLRGFRRLLSLEKNAPVKQCIACGAVPLFVEFLQRNDSTELQFEAAWVLTNIASSEETEVIVTCNAIPHLVNLLLSPNADIREQVNNNKLFLLSHIIFDKTAPSSLSQHLFFFKILHNFSTWLYILLLHNFILILFCFMLFLDQFVLNIYLTMNALSSYVIIILHSFYFFNFLPLPPIRHYFCFQFHILQVTHRIILLCQIVIFFSLNVLLIVLTECMVSWQCSRRRTKTP